MTKTKCQQEFEKWAKQHALHLELISDEGSYWKDNTALVYGAWCAAWDAALKKSKTKEANNV